MITTGDLKQVDAQNRPINAVAAPVARPREQVVRRPIVRPEKVAVAPARHQFNAPPRAPAVLALGFLVTILIGSSLLSMPFATADGAPAPFVTALFTATSAVCVTGLVVVDTGTYWSFAGQVVILLLIQVGGLGFMTASTFFLVLLGRRVSLNERLLLRASHGVTALGGVIRLTRQVVLLTLVIEGLGALVLFMRLAGDFAFPQSVWLGVFHSVSAFNNAGFDLFGGYRSLTIYNGDPTVLLTIAALIILGGISFTVLLNVLRHGAYRTLLLDTKLVLVTTAVLLVAGTLGVLALEFGNPATLGPMPWPQKVMNAFFASVTPRTAGYNSIVVGGMSQGGLLLTIALMYIGAASGSTGGGIKVNTFAALTAAVVAAVRGKEAVTVFGHELPLVEINRALSVALLALGLIFGWTLLLSVTEPFSLEALLFEVTSAFGTVGLSTGITPDLSIPGRLLIALMMYVGRVGPLTVALALAERRRPERVRYPQAQIKIG